MAEGGDPHQSGNLTTVPGWTNGIDVDALQERSDILSNIMDGRDLSQLKEIIESGWNVICNQFVNKNGTNTINSTKLLEKNCVYKNLIPGVCF